MESQAEKIVFTLFAGMGVGAVLSIAMAIITERAVWFVPLGVFGLLEALGFFGFLIYYTWKN